MSGLDPDIVRDWSGDRLSSSVVQSTLLVAVSRLVQSADREGLFASSGARAQRNRSSWWSRIEQHSRRFPYERLELVRLPEGFEPEFTTKNAFAMADKIVRHLNVPPSYETSRVRRRFANSWSHLVLVAIQASATQHSSPEPNHLGHNLYPFPLYRGDMSLDEAVAVSNVTGAAVPVSAIRPGDCAIVSSRWKGAEDCLVSLGVAARGARPNMLVHPLQLSRLPHGCERNRATNQRLELAAVPLTALRTVRLLDAPYDVKLAVNISFTSERRLLFQMTCQNAPGISRIVRTLASESQIADSLGFQFDAASLSLLDYRCAPHLSLIVRDQVAAGRDEMLIPAVDFWYGQRRAIGLLRNKTSEQLYAWWTQYCATVIPGPVVLLAEHGLGTEPHLQNVLIGIRKGIPSRAILRDLDGTILSSAAFNRWRKLGQLVSFTAQYSPPWKHAIDRLVHSLFHAHIGEAIVQLSLAFGCNPDRLLKIVDDVLRSVHEDVKPAARESVVAVMRSTTVKRLLAMALTSSSRRLLFRN